MCAKRIRQPETPDASLPCKTDVSPSIILLGFLSLSLCLSTSASLFLCLPVSLPVCPLHCFCLSAYLCLSAFVFLVTYSADVNNLRSHCNRTTLLCATQKRLTSSLPCKSVSPSACLPPVSLFLSHSLFQCLPVHLRPCTSASLPIYLFVSVSLPASLPAFVFPVNLRHRAAFLRDTPMLCHAPLQPTMCATRTREPEPPAAITAMPNGVIPCVSASLSLSACLSFQ